MWEGEGLEGVSGECGGGSDADIRVLVKVEAKEKEGVGPPS